MLSGGTDPNASLTVVAGTVDLGGAATSLSNVTLTGGSIVDGTLNVSGQVDLYSGTILANIAGTTAVNMLGTGTAILGGDNTYSGGTDASSGTLIAANATSLPGTASGAVQSSCNRRSIGPAAAIGPAAPGNWLTARLPLGLTGPALSSRRVSSLSIDGTVDVAAIAFQGDAAVNGGTIELPGYGGTIDVVSGTGTIQSTIAGGNLTETVRGPCLWTVRSHPP